MNPTSDSENPNLRVGRNPDFQMYPAATAILQNASRVATQITELENAAPSKNSVPAPPLPKIEMEDIPRREPDSIFQLFPAAVQSVQKTIMKAKTAVVPQPDPLLTGQAKLQRLEDSLKSISDTQESQPKSSAVDSLLIPLLGFLTSSIEKAMTNQDAATERLLATLDTVSQTLQSSTVSSKIPSKELSQRISVIIIKLVKLASKFRQEKTSFGLKRAVSIVQCIIRLTLLDNKPSQFLDTANLLLEHDLYTREFLTDGLELASLDHGGSKFMPIVFSSDKQDYELNWLDETISSGIDTSSSIEMDVSEFTITHNRDKVTYFSRFPLTSADKPSQFQVNYSFKPSRADHNARLIIPGSGYLWWFYYTEAGPLSFTHRGFQGDHYFSYQQRGSFADQCDGRLKSLRTNYDAQKYHPFMDLEGKIRILKLYNSNGEPDPKSGEPVKFMSIVNCGPPEREGYMRIASEKSIHKGGTIYSKWIVPAIEFCPKIALLGSSLLLSHDLDFVLVELESCEVIAEGTLSEKFNGYDMYSFKSAKLCSSSLMQLASIELFTNFDCYRQLIGNNNDATAAANSNDQSKFLGLLPSEEVFDEDALSKSEEDTKPATSEQKLDNGPDENIKEENASIGVGRIKESVNATPQNPQTAAPSAATPTTTSTPVPTATTKEVLPSSALLGLYSLVRKLAAKTFSNAYSYDITSGKDLLQCAGAIEVSPIFFNSAVSLLQSLNNRFDASNYQLKSMNLILLYIVSVHLQRAAKVQSGQAKTSRLISYSTLESLSLLLPNVSLPDEYWRINTISRLKAEIYGSILSIGLAPDRDFAEAALQYFFTEKAVLNARSLKHWLECLLMHPMLDTKTEIRTKVRQLFFDLLTKNLELCLDGEADYIGNFLVSRKGFPSATDYKMRLANLLPALHFTQANYIKLNMPSTYTKMVQTVMPKWKKTLSVLSHIDDYYEMHLNWEHVGTDVNVTVSKTLLQSFYFWSSILLGRQEEMSESILSAACEHKRPFSWQIERDKRSDVVNEVDLKEDLKKEGFVAHCYEVPQNTREVWITDFPKCPIITELYRMSLKTGLWEYVCNLNPYYIVQGDERLKVVVRKMLTEVINSESVKLKFKMMPTHVIGLGLMIMEAYGQMAQAFELKASKIEAQGKFVQLFCPLNRDSRQELSVDELKPLLTLRGCTTSVIDKIEKELTSPESTTIKPQEEAIQQKPAETRKITFDAAILLAINLNRGVFDFEGKIVSLVKLLLEMFDKLALMFSSMPLPTYAGYIFTQTIKPRVEQFSQLLSLGSVFNSSKTIADQANSKLTSILESLEKSVEKLGADKNILNTDCNDCEMYSWQPLFGVALAESIQVLAHFHIRKPAFDFQKVESLEKESIRMYPKFLGNLLQMVVKTSCKPFDSKSEVPSSMIEKLILGISTPLEKVCGELGFEEGSTFDVLPDSLAILGDHTAVLQQLNSLPEKSSFALATSKDNACPWDDSLWGRSKAKHQTTCETLIHTVSSQYRYENGNLATNLEALKVGVTALKNLIPRIKKETRFLNLMFQKLKKIAQLLQFPSFHDMLTKELLDAFGELVNHCPTELAEECKQFLENSIVGSCMPNTSKFAALRLKEGLPDWLVPATLKKIGISADQYSVLCLLQPERCSSPWSDAAKDALESYFGFEKIVGQLNNSPQNLVTKIRLIKLLQRFGTKQDLIDTLVASLPAAMLPSQELDWLNIQLENKLSKIDLIKREIFSKKSTADASAVTSNFQQFRSKLYSRIKSQKTDKLGLVKQQASGETTSQALRRKEIEKSHTELPLPTLAQLAAWSVSKKRRPSSLLDKPSLQIETIDESSPTSDEEQTSEVRDLKLALKKGIIAELLLDMSQEISQACRREVQVKLNESAQVDLSEYSHWACISASQTTHVQVHQESTGSKFWIGTYPSSPKQSKGPNLALKLKGADSDYSSILKSQIMVELTPCGLDSGELVVPARLPESDTRVLFVPNVYKLHREELNKLESHFSNLGEILSSRVKLIPLAMKLTRQPERIIFSNGELRRTLSNLLEAEKDSWLGQLSSDTSVSTEPSNLDETVLLSEIEVLDRNNKVKGDQPILNLKCLERKEAGAQLDAYKRVMIPKRCVIVNKITKGKWEILMHPLKIKLEKRIQSLMRYSLPPVDATINYQLGVSIGLLLYLERKIWLEVPVTFWSFLLEGHITKELISHYLGTAQILNQILNLAPPKLSELTPCALQLFGQIAGSQSPIIETSVKAVCEQKLKETETYAEQIFNNVRLGFLDVTGVREYTVENLESFFSPTSGSEEEQELDSLALETECSLTHLLKNDMVTNALKMLREADLAEVHAKTPTQSVSAEAAKDAEESESISLGGLFD